MKIGILSILVLSFNLIQGQTYVKTTEPFTAKNGEIFKVGDKILIGSPADFSNIYTYFTQGKNLEIKKDAVGTIKIGNNITNYDNRIKYAEIKHFKINSELGTFAVTDALFNVMINIDKALETREIVSKKHFEALWNTSTNMTDSVAYLRMLNKIGSVNIDNAKEFLYLFNNKLYNKVREDEFEFQEQISSTINQLKKDAISKQFNDTLKILLEIDLGNYDFNLNGFPMLWNDNSMGVQILSDSWNMSPEDINKNNVSLTDLRLSFTNKNDFSLLPLNKDKANLFVKHRKDSRGNIDRKVYMFVHFKLKNIEDINNSEIKYEFFKVDIKAKILNAEIIKICLFEDEKFYNWLNNIE